MISSLLAARSSQLVTFSSEKVIQVRPQDFSFMYNARSYYLIAVVPCSKLSGSDAPL